MTCEVSVPNVLDLRPAAAQTGVGLNGDGLHSEVGDYEACQRVGVTAHQLGLAGILAPAATARGETFALFPTNINVKHWPTIVRTDVWHGLPLDPRRLRLVDSDAGAS